VLALALPRAWCGVVLLPWDDEREDWIGEGAEQTVCWVRALGGWMAMGFIGAARWLVGGSRHHSTAETAGRHEERRESLIPKSIKT
jgi:hypothetical protein